MKKRKILSAISSVLIGTAIAISSTVTCFAQNEETEKTPLSSAFNVLTKKLEEEENEDFAYKCSLDLELSKAMSKEIGTEIKPINISGIINQKDGKASLDGKIKYNSKDLLNLNGIYDIDNEKAYLKVPEISNSYISGSMADIEKILNDVNVDENGETNDIISGDEMPEINFPELDAEATMEKLMDYLAVAAENLPELKDSEGISGEISGHKYDFTAKGCELKADDIKKISNALYNKAKDDDFMKQLADNWGDEDKTTDENLKEMFDVSDIADNNLSVDMTVYYDDGDFSGIMFKDDTETMRLLLVYDNGDFAIDFADSDKMMNTTLTGYLNTSYGVLNGEFDYKNEIESYIDSTNIVIKDLNIDPSDTSGKVTINSKSLIGNESISDSTTDIDFSVTDTKADISLAFTDNDAKDTMFKAHFVGEEITPVDVVLPTKNVYNIANEADMAAFLGTCDFNGFTTHVKDVLGDELYNFIIDLISFGDDNSDDSDDPDDDPVIPPDDSDDQPTIAPVDNKDVSSKKDDSSSKSELKATDKNTNSTKNTSDKSANTGVKSGAFGIATLLLVGSILVIKKKK